MLSREGSEAIQSNDGAVDVDALIKRFGDGETLAGDNKIFAEGVLNTLGQEFDAECPICFDAMDMPVIIPNCMHQW